MASTDLSEIQKTRTEMATAAFEIAVNEYALAHELERRWSRLRPLAGELRMSALLFERMKKEAQSPREIDRATLGRLGVLFEKAAMRIHEILEVARELADCDTVTASVLVTDAHRKIQLVAALTQEAALILDLRLES